MCTGRGYPLGRLSFPGFPLPAPFVRRAPTRRRRSFGQAGGARQFSQVRFQPFQRELGFGLTVEPTGAFYVFCNASHLSTDSLALAFDILEKAHVGVTPGIDFGPHGQGYLRFSYANSLDKIAEGLDRLEAYLRRYHDQ